jgi:hypothetical protein
MTERSTPQRKGSSSTTTPAPTPSDPAKPSLATASPAEPRSRRKARIESLVATRPSTQADASKPRATKAKSASARQPATNRSAATRGASPQRSVRSLSALDAAAQVLSSLKGKMAESGLSAPQLIERMAEAKLWMSLGGKTPDATLYAAMSREIAAKGPASRFRKISPGHFALAASSPVVAEPAPNGGGKRPATSAQASASSLTTKVDNGSRHARAERKARGGKP